MKKAAKGQRILSLRNNYLSLLLLLFSFAAHGQAKITYTPMNQAGYTFFYDKADSGRAVPFRNLSTGRGTTRPGPLVVNTADSLLYYWNGVMWVKLATGTSGGGTFIGIDSITYAGSNICWWKSGASTCYPIIPGVDSVTVTNNLFCQYKNGVPTCYTITGDVLGSGIDSVTVHGNQLCQWDSGISVCYTINNVNTGIDSITVVDTTMCTWTGGVSTCFPFSTRTRVYVLPDLYVDDVINAPYQSIGSLHADGLVSGGYVTKADCWKINVSPVDVYISKKHIITGQTLGIPVDTSNVSFPRSDIVIVDTFGVVSVLKGTASIPVVSPTINPSSQFILATIQIPAGSSCLGIVQRLIYDENISPPTEWAHATSGTISTAFGNTANPYHLTKALFVQTYADQSTISFTDSQTDSVVASLLFTGAIYTNGPFPLGNYFQLQFFMNGVAVSNKLPLYSGFGFNPNDSGHYQIFAIPFSRFTFSSIYFNKIVITMAGNDLSGAKGFYLDFLQLQSGIAPTIKSYVDSTTITGGHEFNWYNGFSVDRGSVGGGNTSFTANLLIYTNTLTPTGVLANADAFKAGLTAQGPGDNNDSVTINGFRIVDGSGAGQVGLIEISVSRLVVIPEGMFRGNTEITGFEDLSSLLSSGSEIRQAAFKNSTLQFFSSPLFGDIVSSNVGDSAFFNCNSLSSVYLPAWEAADNTTIFKSSEALIHLTVKVTGTSVSSIETANSFTANILANVPAGNDSAYVTIVPSADSLAVAFIHANRSIPPDSLVWRKWIISIDTSNIANFSQKVRSLFSSTSPITYSNGAIGIITADGSHTGAITSTDWNTFNNKFSRSGDTASRVTLPQQSNATPVPLSGVTMFDSSGRWSYRTDLNKTVSFSTSRITAATSVVDSLPNYSGTLVMKYNPDTIFNKVISGSTVTNDWHITGNTLLSRSARLGTNDTSQVHIGTKGTDAIVIDSLQAVSMPVSVTTPLLIGGTGSASPLTFKATTGAGTTGSDMIFQVGPNGGTEAIRIANNGVVTYGVGYIYLGVSDILLNRSGGGLFDITAQNTRFSGKLYIGGTVLPTAKIHIAAGTATANTAPLQFTAGVNETTARAGLEEYDGTERTATNSTAVRGTYAIVRLNSSAAGTLTLATTYTNYVFTGTTTTWTLPAVSGTTNHIFYIKNRGSGAITLGTAAAANELYTTSAVATLTINAGEGYVLMSDGTYFNVISKY